MHRYKLYLQIIFFAVVLTQFTSCGPGNNSETRLEITHSFAMTTPYFGGGLIISGVNNTSGKTFSKALSATKTVGLKLDPGTWTIAAMGWDGGTNSSLNFSGITHCGKTTAKISKPTEVINLSLSPENCNLPFFNNNDSSNMMSGVTPPQFKPVKLINTCNSFFEGKVTPTNNIQSKLVTDGNSGNVTFCETAAPELRSKIRRVRIYALEKGIFQNVYNKGFLSPCLSTNNTQLSVLEASSSPNPYDTSQLLRLPLKNIPFGIAIYDGVDCTPNKLVNEFEFTDGLLGSYPKNFDHLVRNYTSDSFKIILPANSRGRAVSIFEPLKPMFESYDSTNQVFQKFDVTPTGSNFDLSLSSYTHRFSPGEKVKIKIPNETTCPLPLAHTTAGSIGFTTGNSLTCLSEDSQVFITFQTDLNSFGDISVSSFTQNINIIVEPSGFDQKRTDLQKVIIKMIGHDKDPRYNLFFGAPLQKGADGELSMIRKIFSHEMVGGFFRPGSLNTTFNDACVNASGTRQFTFFDPLELSFNTFKFVLSSSPVSSPGGFICNPSDKNESSCGSTIGSYSSFQKRLLFYDYKNSLLHPAFVMEFRCDELLGKLEESSKYIFSVLRHDTKKMINWATPTWANQDTQRFEVLESFKSYDVSSNSPVLIKHSSMMSRLFKTDYTIFEGMHYEFKTATNLTIGDYKEDFIFHRFSQDTNSTLSFSTNMDTTFQSTRYNSWSNPPFFVDDLPTFLITLVGFKLSNTFPQNNTVTTSITMTDPNTLFSGNNLKFNGGTEMNIDVFNPGNDLFTTNFGTSFFTSP